MRWKIIAVVFLEKYKEGNESNHFYVSQVVHQKGKVGREARDKSFRVNCFSQN